MAIRAISTASAFLGALATSHVMPSQAQADNFHPGRVIERGSDAPVSADVKAWAPSQRSDSGGSCPEFGNAPADAQTSDPSNGEFRLTVSKGISTYHVVYCSNGYHERIDQHLPNDQSGSSVIPIPAQLRRHSEMESASIQADIIYVALFALNELGYLYQVDPEAFQAAMSSYGGTISEQNSSAGEVFGGLQSLVAQWAPSF